MKTTNAKVYRAIKDINQIQSDLDVIEAKKSKVIELCHKSGSYKLWDFYQAAIESHYNKLLAKDEQLAELRKEEYAKMEFDFTNPFGF